MEWSVMSDTTGTKRATENRTSQAEEASARIAAGLEGGTNLIRNIMQASQGYNAKLFEFATANYNATLACLSKLAGTKSPSESIELTTRYMREQSEVLTQQARELAQMAQKLMPKAGDAKGFS
jgi:hypothetical protein